MSSREDSSLLREIREPVWSHIIGNCSSFSPRIVHRLSKAGAALVSTISSLTVENEDCLQQGFRERYYGLSFRHSHSFIINCANYFKSALKFSFCVYLFFVY